jgi:hypothetical protein
MIDGREFETFKSPFSLSRPSEITRALRGMQSSLKPIFSGILILVGREKQYHDCVWTMIRKVTITDARQELGNAQQL